MKESEKKVPKEQVGDPELGLKLRNFRTKLAFSIGQKKISQQQFADMYGAPSGRAIASYELADSAIPVSLLYSIWKQGNSVDHIFGDGPITDSGREKAIPLYQHALELERLAELSEAELNRALALAESEEKHGATKETRKTEKDTKGTAGNRRASNTAAGKIKKR